MRLLPGLALAIFLAPLAARAELAPVFRQPMEGVYFQDWSAQVLGIRNGSGMEVYVVGEGKAGDFFGVISVDCRVPAASRWLATGGFLIATDVPGEAVTGIRQMACG